MLLADADHICVQSLDGRLSFFEGAAHTFDRYLPNFLVPGPLLYATPIDSFITSTAALELEVYKYSALAAAVGEKEAGRQGGAGVWVGRGGCRLERGER